MTDVENDVNETFNLDEYSRNTFGKYSSVYPYTNENLDLLFSHLDVSGKNVLSVAASGDQSFYAYHNGASNVDIFDINCLTKYYYYLRIWVIKYFNYFYLEDFEISKREEYSNKYFEILLSIVEPSTKDEMDAYNYWKRVLKKCKSNWGDNGFNYFLTNIFFADDISDNRKGIKK